MVHILEISCHLSSVGISCKLIFPLYVVEFLTIRNCFSLFWARFVFFFYASLLKLFYSHIPHRIVFSSTCAKFVRLDCKRFKSTEREMIQSADFELYTDFNWNLLRIIQHNIEIAKCKSLNKHWCDWLFITTEVVFLYCQNSALEVKDGMRLLKSRDNLLDNI